MFNQFETDCRQRAREEMSEASRMRKMGFTGAAERREAKASMWSQMATDSFTFRVEAA